MDPNITNILQLALADPNSLRRIITQSVANILHPNILADAYALSIQNYAPTNTTAYIEPMHANITYYNVPITDSNLNAVGMQEVSIDLFVIVMPII